MLVCFYFVGKCEFWSDLLNNLCNGKFKIDVVFLRSWGFMRFGLVVLDVFNERRIFFILLLESIIFVYKWLEVLLLLVFGRVVDELLIFDWFVKKMLKVVVFLKLLLIILLLIFKGGKLLWIWVLDILFNYYILLFFWVVIFGYIFW